MNQAAKEKSENQFTQFLILRKLGGVENTWNHEKVVVTQFTIIA